MSGKALSRRNVAIGGTIATALGLAAIGLTVPRLFGHRYRPSPYDDLFAHLIDRDEAVKVGKALADRASGRWPGNDVNAFDKPSLARWLRSRLGRRTLAEVTNSDLAEGLLVEVKGWVLPLTLAMLCLLAALVD